MQFFLVMFPSTELIAEKLNYSVFGKTATEFFRRLVDHVLQRKALSKDEKVSFVISAHKSGFLLFYRNFCLAALMCAQSPRVRN